MKNMRYGAVTGLVVAGAVALTACGSDNNTAAPGGGGASGSGASAPAPSSGACASGSLMAAGSTAQANAMSAWVKAFQTQCSGATVNYGGGGSGAGVTSFVQGTVDFAGSDFPLSAVQKPMADARCGAGNQAIDLPMVPGPIGLGYNLPGVTSLNLSAANLAKIFSGAITKWDDPALAKDNAGVKLPSLGIQTFHRSDGSGTSFNFTNYLANEAKSDWTFGANKDWKAPGGQGSKGTAGIAQGVKATAGGIGYMEESFATQNQIPFAKVGNAGGTFVELTADNAKTFLAAAKSTGAGNDLKLSFDYTNTDANAYPVLLVTYEIVCEKGNKADKLPLIKGFLTYIAGSGQGLLPGSGYIVLPSALQAKVQGAVGTLA